MNHSTINLSGPTSSDDYLDHDDGDHFFASKCVPMKAFDNTDYMIVSSEAIIDILDLTNDEVEQILDDNLISSQDFEMLNSPRLSQPFNRIPRINLATNLTKVASPRLHAQYEGKNIDMRPLETPTIDLVSTMTTPTAAVATTTMTLATSTTTTATATMTTTATTTAMAAEMDAETNDTAKLITMPVSVNKKKSGRTKGARQISMFPHFSISCSTPSPPPVIPIPTSMRFVVCLVLIL